jgi:hypothetical protein
VSSHPSCRKCGKSCPPSKPRVYREKLDLTGGFEWVCGDCVYLEQNPAAPRKRRRPATLRLEPGPPLFDVRDIR